VVAGSSMTQKPHSYLGYSYPAHLTELVKKVWPSDRLAQLPDDHHLRQLFDVAYHASLLRDEDRQVTFRVMFGDPALLPPEDGPPSGLMPLHLDRPRPYNEQEIRRLSMAALFFRSMIGVCSNPDQDLEIWGMVVSGTRWLSSLAGGRYHGAPEPDSLAIHSLGPGRLTIHFGRHRIATLTGGIVESKAFDLFESKWLQKVFSQVRRSFLAEAFGESTSVRFVPVDFDYVRMMSYNIILRTLSVVRNGRHGGTLVIVDPQNEELLRQSNDSIRFKYLIADCPARGRFGRVLRQAIMRLSEVAAAQNKPSAGWSEYQTLMDTKLSDMDEALFDFAHFLADLMAVDGALVVTQTLELVGFGAELRFDAPELKGVRHALDLEGEIWTKEPLDNVGTRHRAVYRFCKGYPRCLAIVVSQDGSVRFVKSHNGEVTYWNQLSW
jgi:sensor domain DACNV-containing protein